MPTYQYACTECGHGFEAVQSFTDDALTECPTCQGRLRKVFGAVGIVFKGSGFYRNDSRDKKRGPATARARPTARPTATKADGKKTGKSDGRPAAPDVHPARAPAARTPAVIVRLQVGRLAASGSSTKGSAA